MIFDDFGDVGLMSGFGANRGMDGAYDGMMGGWGWFRTKKYCF